ncbi:MAG: hypothetical protein K2P33_09355, partial [Acutalibacter sp.]|nr:hypothetical protein [Acutalibacter sp.]
EQTDKNPVLGNGWKVTTPTAEAQWTVLDTSAKVELNATVGGGAITLTRPANAGYSCAYQVTGPNLFSKTVPDNGTTLGPGESYTLTGLNQGEYTIDELKAPDGMVVEKSTQRALSVAPGETASFTVDGENATAKLTAPELGEGEPSRKFRYVASKVGSKDEKDSRSLYLDPGETVTMENLDKGTWTIEGVPYKGTGEFAVSVLRKAKTIPKYYAYANYTKKPFAIVNSTCDYADNLRIGPLRDFDTNKSIEGVKYKVTVQATWKKKGADSWDVINRSFSNRTSEKYTLLNTEFKLSNGNVYEPYIKPGSKVTITALTKTSDTGLNLANTKYRVQWDEHTKEKIENSSISDEDGYKSHTFEID